MDSSHSGDGGLYAELIQNRGFEEQTILGGCIVEGEVLENRVKWKETPGDPMTRSGEYDLWGYRTPCRQLCRVQKAFAGNIRGQREW